MTGPPPTLQFVLDSGVLEVEAYCNTRSCQHYGRAALALLIHQFGPTLLFPDLVGRLRCSVCGTLNIDPRPVYWEREAPGQAKGGYPDWSV